MNELQAILGAGGFGTTIGRDPGPSFGNHRRWLPGPGRHSMFLNLYKIALTSEGVMSRYPMSVTRRASASLSDPGCAKTRAWSSSAKSGVDIGAGNLPADLVSQRPQSVLHVSPSTFIAAVFGSP